MAEIKSLKDQTRRVKAKALQAIEDVLNDPESVSKDFYQQLLLKIAGNVIPRSQEITGEDGEAIKVSFDPVFQDAHTPPQAEGDSSQQSQV